MSKETFLKKAAPKREPLDFIAEVADEGLFISGMSALELASLYKAIEALDIKNPDDIVKRGHTLLIQTCLVDGDGAKIFSEDELGAIAALDYRIVQALSNRIGKLNGMNLEDQLKNSEAAPPGDTPAS